MSCSSETRYATRRTLVVVGVALAYLTLNLRGLTQFHLVGRVSIILMYPVAVTFGIAATLVILREGRVRESLPTLRIYALVIMLTLWIATRGIGGPDPVGSFTLFGIQGMGIMLLLGLTTFVQDRETLLRCTQVIYLVGAVLAVIGIVLYVAILVPWIPIDQLFSVEDDNWAIIFMPTNSFMLRYTGFVGDPSFYPFYASIAFFAGLVVVDYRHPINIVGLSALLITMLLSLSRTFLTSLFGSVVLVVLLLALKGERSRLFGLIVRGSSFATGICLAIIGVMFVWFPTTVQQWLKKRLFGTLFNDARFTVTWPTLIDGIVTQPIVGHGARSVETLIGQTAHSAMFGLLYDFGLVGFILWLAVFGYGTRLALGATLNEKLLALPWLMGLLISFGMNAMNSFQYDLMLWLLIGMATASAVMSGTKASRTADTEVSTDDNQSGTESSPTD